LEKKREHFQRFFFLSNDELLEILSQAKSVILMMPHLRKVFENLVKLELESDEMTACQMVSAEGEQVNLKNCVIRGGEVEEWVP
jgi:dynein heavy chain